MIPLQLQIKNFLSYGPEIETINFEPYHLICLSGKNGHGKSALLDAITWAVWGHARKTGGVSKSDQGLLRIGQTQMLVCLDFVVKNNQYRIRREFMQTYGKPLANLEFGMLDNDLQKIIPLTGKTIRATQASIEKTLNLDFDSFINSAFLRQGNSNEFSKKSPKERKEILANILGLNHFETIKKIALEKIRSAHAQKNILQALLDKLTIELGSHEALIIRLKEIEQSLQIVQLEQKQLDEHQKQFEVQHAAITKKKIEYDNALQALQQLCDDQANAIVDLKALISDWRNIHAAQLKRSNAAQLEQKKQQILQELSLTQTRFDQHLVLKEQELKNKEQLQSTHLQLQTQYNKTVAQREIELDRLALAAQQTQQKHAALTAQIQEHQTQLDLTKKELLALDIQLQKLTHEITTYASQEKQFEKRKQFFHQWTALGNALSTQLNALRRKNTLVSDDAPNCPLCDQNLSAARRRFLKQQFTHDEHFLHYRITRLEKILKNLKNLLIEQHATLDAITKLKQQEMTCTAKKQNALQLQEKLKSQIIVLQQECTVLESPIKQEQAALITMGDQLKLLKERCNQMIEGDAQFQLKHAEVAVVTTALAALAYDPSVHEALKRELGAIESQLQSSAQSAQQLQEQAKRRTDISHIILSIKQLRSTIITKQKELEIQLKALECLRELDQKIQELKNEQTIVRQRKEQLLQERGGLENQRTKLEQYQQETITHKKQMAAHTHEIDDLQAIAQATGKDGVQALLIEQVIPELEQEANQLLSKLTENQTQLFIESLRDLKKGGAKETLDIKISDAVGIRPYEMFSGGEAFRIDFALRIALSKLLARRSGTTLQTLIIDEGFGSQDEEGLGHIMDALYKIQDDFAKIIIVSHLPAMKDQFPVHFVVEKGARGSQVHVVEQG